MTRNPAHPIRAARETAGYDQQTFAAMIGVTKGQLSNIESGKRRFTTGVARRAELALDGVVPDNSLVRYADDLPATLRERITAIPGLLSCLTLTPDPARKYGLPAVRTAV